MAIADIPLPTGLLPQNYTGLSSVLGSATGNSRKTIPGGAFQRWKSHAVPGGLFGLSLRARLLHYT